MGDHRLNVEISVIGSNGEKHEINWWVNWSEDKPAKLFDAMVEMAERANLPVYPFHSKPDNTE